MKPIVKMYRIITLIKQMFYILSFQPPGIFQMKNQSESGNKLEGNKKSKILSNVKIRKRKEEEKIEKNN